MYKRQAEENRRKIYKITEKGAGLLQEEYERLNHLVEDGKKFFSFEGARKDPPEDNGGGQEKEEEVKIEESNGTEAAGVGETRDSEKVREKREMCIRDRYIWFLSSFQVSK